MSLSDQRVGTGRTASKSARVSARGSGSVMAPIVGPGGQPSELPRVRSSRRRTSSVQLELGQLEVERRRRRSARRSSTCRACRGRPGDLVGQRGQPVVGEQRVPGAGVAVGQLGQRDGALDGAPGEPAGAADADLGGRPRALPSRAAEPAPDPASDPAGVDVSGPDGAVAPVVTPTASQPARTAATTSESAPWRARGGRDREPGERGEVAVGADVAGDGVDPDLAGDLPGVAAERRGDDVEGLVGDARVDVHAAVVVGGVDVVAQVGRAGGPCPGAGRRRRCRARPSSAARRR